jgi:hypothetical protein
LYLRDAAAGEFDEPKVTDLEELVAEANQGGWRWDERCRAYTMVVFGLLALCVGFVALLRTGEQRPAVVFGTVLAGVGLAMLGSHARRAVWPLPVSLLVTVALGAVPMFALAATALPLGGGLGHLVVALCLGASFGAAAALVALRHMATLLVLLLTLFAVPVAALVVWLHASFAEAAAVAAVVVLVALGVAPSVSGRLAELTTPDLAATTDPAAGAGAVGELEADVSYLVALSRRTLVALNALCAVILAGCVLVLGSTERLSALAMATTVSLALLLRAGQIQLLSSVLPVLAAGFLGLVAVALHAGGYFGAPVWASPLIVLVLAGSAVIIGVTGALGEVQEDEPPRWLATLRTLLLFLTVLNALGVFGLFGFLIRLGGGV